MKTLKESYMSQINEYRTKKQAVEDVKDQQNVTLDDVKGEEPEDVSGGVWAVEEPTEDDIVKGIDKETLNRNKKRILMRLKADKPFFVQGQAGWGKTSIITKLAHQVGRTVITVYLDKAEATDLGGIPVAAKSKRGANYSEYLMPGWAKVMWDNPKKKFLLFFDEMNQAQPDVMNALMPIVLKTEVCGKKFNNFVVGAAGNFEDENDAVNELSKPLKSRFGGTIIWESGDWDDAFKHLHKVWDEKTGKEFIDLLREYADLFNNPRDMEMHIIDEVYKLKQDKDSDIWDSNDFLDQFELLAKDDLKATDKSKLAKLAEKVSAFVKNKGVENGEGRKPAGRERSKDIDMVPENVKNAILGGMTKGFVIDDKDPNQTKYGCSRENIGFIAENVMNEEMLQRLIRKFEAEGKKFKYEKNSEWKKAGYADPEADD